jgi:hypothetical protein
LFCKGWIASCLWAYLSWASSWWNRSAHHCVCLWSQRDHSSKPTEKPWGEPYPQKFSRPNGTFHQGPYDDLATRRECFDEASRWDAVGLFGWSFPRMLRGLKSIVLLGREGTQGQTSLWLGWFYFLMSLVIFMGIAGLEWRVPTLYREKWIKKYLYSYFCNWNSISEQKWISWIHYNN